MKMYPFLLALVLVVQISFAQAPTKFSFQGVARNAAGKVVAGRDVGIRISIRPETALGSPVYQETHTAKTTANGVFNIEVGGGLPQSGQFSNINWKSLKYFLQLELDPDGGSSYTNLGATQLLSVPYALHAAEANRWKNDDPIVQEGIHFKGAMLPTLDWSFGINRLMWYPRLGAFRFGHWNGEYVWSETNVGNHSFAGGINAIADGDNSFAFGSSVKSIGHFAVTMGYNNEAGFQALAIGSDALALGENSIAIGERVKSLNRKSAALGYNLQSNSQYGLVLGISNDISDAVSDEIKPTQRLFQIGNGEEGFDPVRRNALTILRNGNVGIGNNALVPTYILDVGARMRLRSNSGSTAGLWLDNASNVPYCFIGGNNDVEAGFYFEEATAWRFNVHKNGSAWLAGTLTQNSDIRLKEYLKPLSGSLGKLYDLKGYHYQWKDKTRSQGLQTGLIAQEVETVFPELVETDKEGYKSVNYIGLIPHLLEAVKELKNENARMQDQIEASSQQSSIIQSQTDTTAGVTEHNAASFVALLLIVMICLYVAVPKHRGI